MELLKHGKKHSYYACNNSKRRKCDKQNVKKEYIEELIVLKARELLTDDNINKIALEVVSVLDKEKDNSNLKRLEKLLNKNHKEKNNLIDSLKVCDIDSVRKSIFEEIKKLDNQCSSIEKEILHEEKQSNLLTIPQIKFFLTQMKKGNINDLKYRKLLINTFINKIYLYDDKLTILFNTQDKEISLEISLIDEIESSFIESLGSPINKKTSG